MGRKRKQISGVTSEEVESWLLSDFGKHFESDDWNGQSGVFCNGKLEVVAVVEDSILEITCDGEKTPRYFQLLEKGTSESLVPPD